MSPLWGLPGRYTGFINVAPLGLARGGAKVIESSVPFRALQLLDDGFTKGGGDYLFLIPQTVWHCGFINVAPLGLY
ncbi:MAG: hypothetical protein B6247_22330 [Candidatus Parabeggiatoa sp. nov. 2]|nr:MAG: hypothetical protein B6247_22330 [Beggiatoa sp. 4572_84]